MKEILLTLLYLILFNLLIYRFKRLQFATFKPFVTLLVFNIKFATGIVVWLVYTFYYSNYRHSDIHKFYQDALVLNNLAQEHPASFAKVLVNSYDSYGSDATAEMHHWYRNFDESPFNENQTIIKLNALLMFVTFKTYFVHILFFCFFSLIGWVLLTNSVFAERSISILALPIMLLPSVLFWTSGILKEPLLVMGLGLSISAILSKEFTWKRGIVLVTGAIIILFTKFYVLACMIPPLLAFALFKRDISVSTIFMKYITINLTVLLLAFNIHYLVPGVNLQQMLMNKQTNAIKEAVYFKAGSRIEMEQIDGSIASIFKSAVFGIRNVIFRPYLWESGNVMMLAGALENVFVLTIMMLCIWFSSKKSMEHLNLFLFLLNFALLYFAIAGMATPVLGNLVRYKTPMLPIFLFAFILLLNREIRWHKLNFIRKQRVD